MLLLLLLRHELKQPTCGKLAKEHGQRNGREAGRHLRHTRHTRHAWQIHARREPRKGKAGGQEALR